MFSLFHRKGRHVCEFVKLPKFCTPNHEGEGLRAKREASLGWMRERGIRYIGNPARSPDRRARGTRAAPSRTAPERPGDAIVRDLVSNGN